jgi:apolipoprotein N-acyltransferase
MRTFTIGRDKSCDVPIADDSVSRVHAEVWLGSDGALMLADRGSSNGTSLIRSTRLGLSLGVDPLGRTRAWQSSFDTADRVLVFDLPQHGIRTIYSRIGEALVDASIAFLLLAFLPLRLRHPTG